MSYISKPSIDWISFAGIFRCLRMPITIRASLFVFVRTQVVPATFSASISSTTAVSMYFPLCFISFVSPLNCRNSYNILILHSVRYFFYESIGERNYALTASVIINKRVLVSIVLSDELFRNTESEPLN